MQVPVSEAKAQLLELVRRAEAGQEVVLTRYGRAVVRIAAVAPPPAPSAKRALLRQLRASAALRARPGASAARSQDYLYDERGMAK